MSLATVASIALHEARPLALMGPFSLALLVRKLRAFAARSPLPNLLTTLRVILTGALALFPRVGWQCALGVLAVFIIDGCDGLVARKLDASSQQGAHFDMEADGFLVLTVCAILSPVGAWIWIGGLLRYAFVFATWLVPSRGEAPRSTLGRYAFAASLTGYMVALATQASLPALAGTLVLCASFARSFYWSFRRGEALRNLT